MFDSEKSIAEAQMQFNRMELYVRGEGQSHDSYTVERRLFKEALTMCLHLMKAYFDEKRGGDVGATIRTREGQELPRERLKPRQFVCVFGELELARYYYHEDGESGVYPLDEETRLPERSYSYYVQELLGQRVARMTYEEAMAEMEQLFGFSPWKHSVEDMAAEAGESVDDYHQNEPAPAPESEEEILVTAIDGKGVPIVKEEPAEHKVRLGRGEKRSRKKEATVAAVYTIAPYERTVEDIIGELRDNQPAPRRPQPQNKHLRATLSGKDNGIAWVAEEMARRDPDGRKRRVCLMDGSKGLWTVALARLGGCTFILDLFHVLEYLWKAAYVFHAEGSAEAEEFVRHRLRMLLTGNVGYVIGGLRQMLSKHQGLSKGQRRTVENVIHYYESNRKWMRYDEYIAAGFPIGSGAVEGACRHLVKDRMEGSGMRWTVPGAESVLKLRAVYLNGQWNTFWVYHMQRQWQERYGHRRWQVADTVLKAG